MRDLMNLVDVETGPGKIGITIDLGKDMVELITAIAAIVKVTPIIIESIGIIYGYFDMYMREAYNVVGEIYSNYTDSQDPYFDLVQEVIGEQLAIDYSIE